MKYLLSICSVTLIFFCSCRKEKKAPVIQSQAKSFIIKFDSSLISASKVDSVLVVFNANNISKKARLVNNEARLSYDSLPSNPAINIQRIEIYQQGSKVIHQLFYRLDVSLNLPDRSVDFILAGPKTDNGWRGFHFIYSEDKLNKAIFSTDPRNPYFSVTARADKRVGYLLAERQVQLASGGFYAAMLEANETGFYNAAVNNEYTNNTRFVSFCNNIPNYQFTHYTYSFSLAFKDGAPAAYGEIIIPR